MFFTNILHTVKIPLRIKRSPTDILKALSHTVEPDPLFPLYLALDDPYLIPNSGAERRSYLLSRASGRKAAHFIMRKYPFAFYLHKAEPQVPAFDPPATFEEKEFFEPSESLLISLMDWGRLKDAMKVYSNLGHKNISEKTKLAFLDILCIYNSTDFAGLQFDEDKLFPADQETLRWTSSSYAERVFNDFSDPPARAFCSIIQGMVRFNNVKGAISKYKEMTQKGMSPCVNTFAALLRAASYHTVDYDDRMEMCFQLLEHQKQLKIAPVLNTFNSLLFTISNCSAFRKGPKLALQTLAEMRMLGIEPSLGTYAQFLLIFYPKSAINTNPDVFLQVLDAVKALVPYGNIRDLADQQFFVAAMKICYSCLKDAEIAFKVDEMLSSFEDFVLPSNLHHILYYDKFLLLIVERCTPETVLPIWDRLIPFVHTPSVRLFSNFLDFITTFDLPEYLPKACADLISLRLFVKDSSLVAKILYIMAHFLRDENRTVNFASTVRGLLLNFPVEPEQDSGGKQFVVWDSPMLSDAILVLVKDKDFDLAWDLYTLYLKKRDSDIPGQLLPDCLSEFLKSAVENCMPFEKLHSILLYMSECDYVEQLMDGLALVNETICLSAREKGQLQEIQMKCQTGGLKML